MSILSCSPLSPMVEEKGFPKGSPTFSALRALGNSRGESAGRNRAEKPLQPRSARGETRERAWSLPQQIARQGRLIDPHSSF